MPFISHTIHAHMYAHTQTYTHTHTHIHIHIHTHHTHTPYIHTHIYTHTHTYTHTYTHTHTHTQISRDHSCDRVSGIADISAPSLYGRLDSIYKTNDQAPLKWQYFGSEFGVINQYPAGKAPDCDSYDHRFR